jgi:hypothetical protein
MAESLRVKHAEKRKEAGDHRHHEFFSRVAQHVTERILSLILMPSGGNTTLPLILSSDEELSPTPADVRPQRKERKGRSKRRKERKSEKGREGGRKGERKERREIRGLGERGEDEEPSSWGQRKLLWFGSEMSLQIS